MTNQDHPRDLDAPHLEIPSFIRSTDNIGRGAGCIAQDSTGDTFVPGHGGGDEHLDPLASLARLIADPPRAPPIAEQSSKGMREGFERVAREIIAVAEDGVARANENLQEAKTFAAIVLKSGDLLCTTIETEGGRMLQVSRIMREVRAALGGPPPTGPGE